MEIITKKIINGAVIPLLPDNKEWKNRIERKSETKRLEYSSPLFEILPSFLFREDWRIPFSYNIKNELKSIDQLCESLEHLLKLI